MSRTGLSPADLAAQFRDVCGDGSMEWVYTPMQTWLLLDAADMLDENVRLRSCLTDADENARLIMGENAKLRELAERAWKTAERLCQAFDGPCRDDGVTIYKPCPMGERDEECVYGQLQRELRELGVEV